MELIKNTIFINLDKRTDRLEHVRLELAKLNIQNPIRLKAREHRIGAIGCTLSHISCLELAKQQNYETVFICEDDITFTNPELLLENLEKFRIEKGEDWDVLILGGNNCPPFESCSPFFIRISNCQTTTGYIVRRPYYDVLIHNFKQSALNFMREPTKQRIYALDIYWKRLQSSDRWFMIIPPTVIQYENYSDIEGKTVNYNSLMLDMEKKWYMSQFASPNFANILLSKKKYNTNS